MNICNFSIGALAMASTLSAMADSPPVTTRYTYNAQGQVTSIQGKSTVNLAYDSDGNLLSMSGPAIDKVSYGNYLNGSPRQIKLGNRTLSTTYTRTGQPRWIQDPQGNTTTYQFTPVGDLETVTSSKFGLVRKNFYDDARRLIGSANSSGQQVRYTLDAAGNRTQTEYLDTDGQLVGRYRETFDELGRRLTSQWGDAGVMRYQYDAAGNLTGQTNALAQTQLFSVDAWGRRITHGDADGVDSTTRYDAQGNAVAASDARGNQTRYTRDHQGNALRIESPDGGVQQTSYDAQGNLVQRVSPSGAITRFTYDSEGRPASKTYSGFSNLDTRYVYPYPIGWNALRANVEDRYAPPTMASPQEIQTMIYQEPTGQQRIIDTAFSYDDFGRFAGLSLIDQNESFNYQTSGDGTVTSITYEMGGRTYPIATQIKHLPDGPVAELTLGNGSKVVRHYDTAYRLTGITLAGERIASYGYDLLGNVTSSQLEDIKRSFSYDRTSRLIAEQGSYKRITYGYDVAGNRVQTLTTDATTGALLDQQNLTFATDSNRLLARDGKSTRLDAAGNLLDANDGLQYVYDPDNRLMEVRNQQSKKIASYIYDERGRRSAAYEFDVNSGAFAKSTYYRHDPAGHLIGLDEYSPTGPGKKVRWVWLGDLPVAQIDLSLPYLEGIVSVSYLHSDPLNTPRIATDEMDLMVWLWSASGYGSEAPIEQVGGWSPAPPKIPLRFPGQFSELVSPLFYNQNRDYNPELGRYMQSDPLGLAGGLNTFAYAGGNPTSFFDILGLALSGQGTSRAGPGGFPQSALENRAGPRPPTPTEKAVRWATTAAAQKAAKVILDIVAPGGSNFVGKRLFVGAQLFLHSERLGGCDDSGNCSDMRKPDPCDP